MLIKDEVKYMFRPNVAIMHYVVHAYRYAASYNKHRTNWTNLHKYDTLNQEIQVTPDYGYITNSKISGCQVTITITVPSDSYQTGLGPGHRTAKYDTP